MSATPVVRAEGEGERLRFCGGGILTVKASAEETAGSLFIFEDLVSKDKVTPLHIHEDEDETIYVLEGEAIVQIDGEDHLVGQGGIAFAPRGVPHAFRVVSASARLLTLLTPGSAEGFYRGASEPAEAGADPAGPVDFDRVKASAERTGGMRLVGPPPFSPPQPGSGATF